MRWHGRRPGVVTAVVMRYVLRRVKPAVRIRKEQELQSCHGVDQRAHAGNPDLGLAVAWVVLAGVVRLLLLFRFEGGGYLRGAMFTRRRQLLFGNYRVLSYFRKCGILALFGTRMDLPWCHRATASACSWRCGA